MLIRHIWEVFRWEIRVAFRLLTYLTWGVCPLHTTPTNPNPNFQQPYYQTMSYGPNIPPTGTGVPHGPIPDIFFPRTLAYVIPNPRVGDNVGVRD
jgi:hypothetical protein